MRFMLYEGALNADRFIAFLWRLSKDAGQKVFLIVDNLEVHHASHSRRGPATMGTRSSYSTCWPMRRTTTPTSI